MGHSVPVQPHGGRAQLWGMFMWVVFCDRVRTYVYLYPHSKLGLLHLRRPGQFTPRRSKGPKVSQGWCQSAYSLLFQLVRQ
ncbi:hypothetical protein F5B21DRAFT_118883 [Xylaria acuta]|nr:hypothetical protein F5B21DRAFT_118883 [Xylaria acuta]